MSTQQLRSSPDPRRPLFQAACVAIGALALAGCNGAKNAYVAPPPPKVAVAQPLRQPVTSYLELTGNTAPFKAVDLIACTAMSSLSSICGFPHDQC